MAKGIMGKSSYTPSQLATYKLERAKFIRKELIKSLGGKCVVCGTQKNLEFNHIYERTWRIRDYPVYRRMLIYRRESEVGLLDLRCKAHNHSYKPLPLTQSPVPF